MAEGWAFPGQGIRNVKGPRFKAHYFVNTWSVCGRYGFYLRNEFDSEDGTESIDDCKTCRKRVNRQKEKTGWIPL